MSGGALLGQGMMTIDLNWTLHEFPSIVEAFGAGPLTRQIEVFNGVVRETAPQDQELSVLALKMLRAGIHRPHHALLNLLSLSCDPSGATNPYLCRFLAPLCLLERRLVALKRAGFRLTEYRTMMVAPHSFDSLIAEVDVVGGLLADGGKMTPHAPTGDGGDTNYDVDWAHDGMTVRGDVKFFRDWLRKPENPILETLSLLLRGDLAMGLTVKVRFQELSKTELLDVALETLELYRAAMGFSACPEGVRVVEGKGGARAAVATTAAPERLVREVITHPGTRPESLLVIESGMGGGDDDENAIRRNLQKAAQQVPPAAGDRELALVFIGSAIPGSAEDLQAALYGRPAQDPTTGEITYVPGYFSPETGEVDLGHVQGAVFFSILYQETRGVSGRATVTRVGRPFPRRAGLTEAQSRRIAKVGALLSVSQEIDVRFRSAAG